MSKKYRVVIELVLPDEETYKDAAAVRAWVAAWVRDDLIYESDEEFDGEVVDVREI